MKRNTVTIKDIGRELNISPSTVSRALKDHPEISQSTKEAVKRVAEEMNYQPNSLAMSLRYSKSNTIGIVIPEISHFFFSTVISGMEDVAHSLGYNLIITQSNDTLERERENIQTLFNNRVDGVLIAISKETRTTEHLAALMQKGIPVVSFDRSITDLACSQVIVDDFIGGYQATNHLISQGYTRIGHLGGPTTLQLSADRLAGYKKALSDHHIAYNPDFVINGEISNDEVASEATARLLKQEKLDALFAASDMAAIGAINMAHKIGLRVPEDFGVVGFSNWQFTRFTHPTVSTIEQRGFEMGQKATELLIRELGSNEDDFLESETVVLKTKLIVRESSIKEAE